VIIIATGQECGFCTMLTIGDYYHMLHFKLLAEYIWSIFCLLHLSEKNKSI
jgi:hypothetical protein